MAGKKKTEKRTRKQSEEEKNEDALAAAIEKAADEEAEVDADAGEVLRPKEKTKKEKEAEAAGKEYRWWEDAELLDITDNAGARGADKWKESLVHNGVLFPPAYEPHGIPILYNGEPFKMNEQEEELATHFATSREIEQYKNPLFRENFFREFRRLLDKRGEHPIKRLEYCSFDPIWEWHTKQREARKTASREEKKKIKDAKEKEAAPFKFAVLDGREEQLAGYRVEPPGLFRGRGEHPLQGRLKARVRPEDVVINIGPHDPVPEPPEGHRWKQVVHLSNVMWVAMWKDSVTDNFKYVQFASQSSMKGMSDRNKFEKARQLRQHVDAVRESYRKGWNSSDKRDRQLGVALYFIDKLALRCGNEKTGDEADTVGCCSLRYDHVAPVEDAEKPTLKFDFLGKDSVRYLNEVEVEPRVFELIKQFRHGKAGLRKEKQGLFDTFDPSDLNEHLKSFMPGLSAKVFRTYNASVCLTEQLAEMNIPKKATPDQKKVMFNDANKAVAILCNHQRAVSKTHGAGMKKLEQQIKELNDLKTFIEELKDMKDQKAAEKKFYERQDEEQNEWLEEHGSDKDKEKYVAAVEKRVLGRKPSSSSPSKKKSSSSKSSSAKKSSSTKKGGKKDSKKKDDKKKKDTKKGSKKKFDSDDEDTPIGELFGKKDSKKKGAKKEETKKTAGKKKPSPKSSPKKASPKKSSPKKETKKAAPKKASPKKASPKKAAPKKGKGKK